MVLECTGLFTKNGAANENILANVACDGTNGEISCTTNGENCCCTYDTAEVELEDGTNIIDNDDLGNHNDDIPFS